MSGDLLGLTLHAQEISDEQLIGEHAAAMRPWPRTLLQALALDVYSRELGQRHAPEPRLERRRREGPQTRTDFVSKRRREARDRLFPPLEVVRDPDPDDAA